MEKNRRGFLKLAGCTAMGVGCGFPLLATLHDAADSDHDDHADDASSDEKVQWAMVVDVEKCMNQDVQQACMDACHKAHKVPDLSVLPAPKNEHEKIQWIWPEKYEHAFPDQAHEHAPDSLTAEDANVLVLCNHCNRPPCVRVCPTQATWKRKQDGIVMMDMHRCIGCRYCMAACPYGSRSFNYRDPDKYIAASDDATPYPKRTKGVVEKCTFCAERIRVGEMPYCVEAAENTPGGQGALTFGNLKDPESPVAEKLRENYTICRRVSLGTGPNVYYII